MERGFEFRIYMESGHYASRAISVKAAWDLVEFISNIERAKRLALAQKEEIVEEVAL